MGFCFIGFELFLASSNVFVGSDKCRFSLGVHPLYIWCDYGIIKVIHECNMFTHQFGEPAFDDLVVLQFSGTHASDVLNFLKARILVGTNRVLQFHQNKVG